jgi:hypothetical protein
MHWNELSDFGGKAIRKIMFDNALVRTPSAGGRSKRAIALFLLMPERIAPQVRSDTLTCINNFAAAASFHRHSRSVMRASEIEL